MVAHLKTLTAGDPAGKGARSQHQKRSIFRFLWALAACATCLLAPVSARCDVLGWGQNEVGELGDGTTTDRTAPGLIGGLSNVFALAAGGSHSLALLTDGTVWSWGDNRYGQLGDGTITNRSAPVQVTGLTGVIAISSGYCHNLALRSDGTVWAWGRNDRGQIGDGTFTDRSAPVQVSGLSGVTAIAAGSWSSLALLADGSVRSWGDNHSGQLGDGTNTNQSAPVQVIGLAGVKTVAGAGSHFFAILNDLTVMAWGSNVDGELGDKTNQDRNTPVPVAGLTQVSAITGGTSHSLALRTDGSVWSWGDNAWGELGDGTYAGRSTPAQIDGLVGVTAISSCGFHCLALLSSGAVRAWGVNSYGVLGDGTTTDRPTPVAIAGLSGIISVCSGFQHCFALTGGSGATLRTTITVAPVSGEIGQAVTLSARLTNDANESGIKNRSVSFKLDGVEISGSPSVTDTTGTAKISYTIPPGSAGSHTIAARFAGDNTFLPSFGGSALTANRLATTVTVPNISGRAGQTVTVTATLTQTSTGGELANALLTFKVDGAQISGSPIATDSMGKASIGYTVPFTSADSHAIEVTYAGAGDYAPSTGSGTLTVTKYGSSLAVGSVTGSPGQAVTLLATLTRTSNNAVLSDRTVAFRVNSTVVGNATTDASGVAMKSYKVPSTAPTPGTMTIDATFAGDSGYLASEGTANLSIRTRTRVTVSSYRGIVGQTLSVKALLKAGTSAVKGATILYYVDGNSIGSAVTNSSGAAFLSHTVTEMSGDHTLTLQFAGNSVYGPSSATATLTVYAAATKVAGEAVSGLAGASVKVGARLTRTADGAPLAGRTLDFYDSTGSKLIKAVTTDSNGRAWITVVAPGAGSVTKYVVKFAGEPYEYAPSSGSSSVKGN